MEETLQALHNLAWIGAKVVQVWGRHGRKSVNRQWIKYISQLPVSATLKIGIDILRDLRGHGRFRLVEVEDDEIQVYVDLF